MIVLWFLGWLVLVLGATSCFFVIVGGSIYAMKGFREDSKKKKVLGIWLTCGGLVAAFPLYVLFATKFLSR